MPKTPLDALAEELAIVAGRVEREASLRIDAIIAELRRVDSERELRLVNLERAVSDRLALVKDGAPGRDADPAAVAQMVTEAVAREVAGIPKPKDGLSVTVEDVAPLIASEVSKAVAAIPAPKDGAPGKDGRDGKDGVEGPAGVDGKSITVDEVAPLIAAEVVKAVGAIPAPKDGRDGKDGADGKDGPEGRPGADGAHGKDGKLPVVRAWSERVYYEGEAATLNGSTFQALRDTGRAPPCDDWQCIASAGRDGADGRSLTIRGTYADGSDYAALDIVALNGASFAAKRDNPGPCPGDGWQLIAKQGGSGKPGERGAPGPKGDAGPKIAEVNIDGSGLLTLEHDDGTAVTCDLYPVLSKIA